MDLTVMLLMVATGIVLIPVALYEDRRLLRILSVAGVTIVAVSLTSAFTAGAPFWVSVSAPLIGRSAAATTAATTEETMAMVSNLLRNDWTAGDAWLAVLPERALPASRCQEVIPFLVKAVEERESAGERVIPPLPALVAVAAVESSCRLNTPRSSKGAACFMQVMPSERGPLFVGRPSANALEADPTLCARWGVRILADAYQEAVRVGERDPEWGAFRRYNGSGAVAERYATTVQNLAARIRLSAAADLAGRLYSASRPLSTWPMSNATLIKGYGIPVDYQTAGYHTGIDLTAPPENGQEPLILAAEDGVVVWVGPLYLRGDRAGRGEYSIVLYHGMNDEGRPVHTLYGHNSAAFVQIGDHVQAGQPIGRQGNEGYSFGSHLHFEVQVGGWFTGNWREPFDAGEFVDPLAWLP